MGLLSPASYQCFRQLPTLSQSVPLPHCTPLLLFTITTLLPLLTFPTTTSGMVALPCERWNCPCAGVQVTRQKRSVYDVLAMHSSVHSNNDSHDVQKRSLHGHAHHTWTMTQDILKNISMNRLGNNEGHASALVQCLHDWDEGCFQQTTETACRLPGMPQITTITALSEMQLNEGEFLRQAKQFLSQLAVYVEQSRLDEDNRAPIRLPSLAGDLMRLQDHGLYSLLCIMQNRLRELGEQAQDTVHSLDGINACQNLQSLAARDNRDYMVFYTLESTLSTLIDAIQQFTSAS